MVQALLDNMAAAEAEATGIAGNMVSAYAELQKQAEVKLEELETSMAQDMHGLRVQVSFVIGN